MYNMKGKLLGTTKVTKGWKISLIKEVRKELDDAGIGDHIVFRKKNGKVFIEKLE